MGPCVPPTDTLLFGGGSMGETRAGLRVTWHAGRTMVAAGTQGPSARPDCRAGCRATPGATADCVIRPLKLRREQQERDAALAVFVAGRKLRQRMPDPERQGAERCTGPAPHPWAALPNPSLTSPPDPLLSKAVCHASGGPGSARRTPGAPARMPSGGELLENQGRRKESALGRSGLPRSAGDPARDPATSGWRSVRVGKARR